MEDIEYKLYILLKKYIDDDSLAPHLDNPSEEAELDYFLIKYVGRHMFRGPAKYTMFLVEVFINNKDPLDILWRHHCKRTDK